MNIADWKDTARMYRKENKRLAAQVAELKAKLDEYMPIVNMLVLCGEDECRNVEGYANKFRAILDAMITYRQKLEDHGPVDPNDCVCGGGNCSECPR